MEFLENVQIIKKLHDVVISEVASKHNISLNEMRVLFFLSNNVQSFAQDIADELQLAKSHVSLSVNNLEQKGYIIRVQNEQDKKKLRLITTKKAKPIIQDLEEKRKELKSLAFKGIEKNEIENVEKVLTNVLNNIMGILKEEEN